MHIRPHPKRRFSAIYKVLQLGVVQHALRAYRRSVRRIAGGSGRVGTQSVRHARPDGALHAVQFLAVNVDSDALSRVDLQEKKT